MSFSSSRVVAACVDVDVFDDWSLFVSRSAVGFELRGLVEFSSPLALVTTSL